MSLVDPLHLEQDDLRLLWLGLPLIPLCGNVTHVLFGRDIRPVLTSFVPAEIAAPADLQAEAVR